MPTYISPKGNPEVWDEKPKGYYTPEEWVAKFPPEIPPGPTLAEAIEIKIAEINNTTMRLITEGFSFVVNGKEYHFGYDETDQANFTKAALVAALALMQNNAEFRQSWRGWIGDTPHTLSLSAQDFLGLATYAGKDHQEAILGRGWSIQESIRAMTDAAEVLNYVDPRTA